MLTNLIAGALGGFLIPQLLARCDIDSPVPSGPFVTRVAYVVGIMRGLTDRFKWCRVSIKHGDHSHGRPKIHQADDRHSV
jgi:magnesium transporter